MMVSGFYCPVCGKMQEGKAPIEYGTEYLVITFYCNECDTSIVVSI